MNMPGWRTIGIIAAKELRDCIRNRWVLAVTAIFAAFALAIAYFGAAQQGAVGFRGIEATIASLVSLVIYLVPLIGLLLGYDAIVAERERGSLDLLLSLPLTRTQLLLGKFFGLSLALNAAIFIGFGAAGTWLLLFAPAGAWQHYLGFMLSAVLLGMAFLSLSLLVSVLATERGRASAAAIIIWFFFVLVYDLLLIGMLVATQGRFAAAALPYLLLANPADVFRILNIAGMQQASAWYGLAGTLPKELASPVLLAAVLLSWSIAPLALAAWRFRK